MDLTDTVTMYMFLTLTAAVLFCLGFWIWMLVDCLKKKNFDKKRLWTIIILILNVVGAVIYFLAIRNKVETKIQKRE
jgi:hypothetical protein